MVLSFVRDRHSFATEDLQRIQDQRAFISALAEEGHLARRVPEPVHGAAVRIDRREFDVGRQRHQPARPGTMASALRDPQTGTVPIADNNYVANVGDSLWVSTKATELFNALKNDSAIPKGLLGGTTIG